MSRQPFRAATAATTHRRSLWASVLNVPEEDALAITSVRDAIEKLSKVFAEQPTKARSKNPSATAVLENGVKFQVTGPHGEKLSTDMPLSPGGGGSAPTPGWLLRASLRSCHATVFATRADLVGVAVVSWEVSGAS